jgi:hypothetical protein
MSFMNMEKYFSIFQKTRILHCKRMQKESKLREPKHITWVNKEAIALE